MNCDHASNILRAVTVLAIVALLGRPCRCLTYYVDAEGGSDLNAGTSQDSAWQTLGKVRSFLFMPGDSILLRRGCQWREMLYVSSSGEEGNPITYGAYGADEALPVINGADLYTDNEWDPAGENIWSKPGHIDFHSETLIASGRAANKFIVTIDGVRFRPVTEMSALEEDTYAYDSQSDRLLVYLPGDPDNHHTESATRSYSIRMEGKKQIVLRDLEIMNSVYNNIYMIHACKHVLLDHLVVHHAGTRGVQILGDELTDNPDGWVEHIRIEHSTIFNNGIRCDSAANDIGMNRNVRCVTVRHCTLYGDGETWGVDGILTGEITRGAGHRIEDNVIFGHCENEIDLKGHQESPAKEGRTVIRNNVLFGSGSAVIGAHFGSRDVDIVHNHISSGATHGIGFYNHDSPHPYDGQEGDFTIAYNIIRDHRLSGIRDAGAGHAITAGGNRVHNNIIVWNGADIDGDSAGIQFQSPNWDIQNNIIWNNGDGSLAYQLRPSTPESEIGLVESHNLVAVDPLFMDAEGGDFRLRADSPAVDEGADLGYAHDIDGRAVPNGTAPDIGAHEWYPSTAPVP